MSFARWSVALVAVMLLAHCRSDPPSPRATPPAPSSRALSVDHLLPGELAEGKDRALGLALPRDVRMLRSFQHSVVARGRVNPEALTDYVRRRVSASAVETSLQRTIFARVHVNGEPPGKQVKIEIVRDDEATMLLIEDITPPEPTPGLSEEERWRRAGVNPQNPLDPNQL